MTNKIFILLGPTASGKSQLSIKLSKDFPFEIINADLFSIYKGLNIGTAKPSGEDLQTTKHYLINKLEPDRNYNVSKFCSDVDQSIKSIYSKKRIPLIVGGSMMYIYQLLNGLTHEYNLSDSDRELIKFIKSKYSDVDLYHALKSDSSISIEKISINDSYRLEKLIERLITVKSNKKKYCGLNNNNNTKVYILFINVSDRDILKKNIHKRTKHMVESGLIEEVRNLKHKYKLTHGSQSMKAIGYRETLDFLNGESSIDHLISAISTSTQQLAKRQMTWKNKFNIDYCINYPSYEYDSICDFITDTIR